MSNKVVIIGAGYVGATIGYALMNQGITSEIVLIDLDKDKAEGEAMDLNHGAAFVKPVKVRNGDYKDCENADLIIITAGANQKPGESRLDLVKKNTGILKNIVPSITEYNKETILLVVTNPVDILTYVTYKLSGFPSHRVMGSGTVLDTSRFRYLLSEHCNLDPRNVHAYIIGEHGDSEVAAWSLTNVAGIPFDRYCEMCQDEFSDSCENEKRDKFKNDISKKVKESAYKIIEKKGATYYAIGLAVSRITESIFRDENTILTVSSVFKDIYGIEEVALSLPTVVNSSGVKNVLSLEINKKEKDEFIDSANMINDIIKDLEI
ncbi:MAG: L-lactate dehydrogenase [Halanaerobiales bacterium]